MRRFLKVLAVVFASFLIVILLLAVSTKIFEDDIAKVALKQVSKSIDAPLEIGSVNFNLLRGFPKATIEFNDLWLKSPEENNNDTIAGIHHLYVSVNSRAAMKGRYEVEKIEVDGLALNYAIGPDSLTNVDFLMSLIPTDTTVHEVVVDSVADTTMLYFNLHQLLLKNVSCSYYDATSNTGARVQVPEIMLEGNIMGDDYTARSKGKVMITDVSFGDYNLQLMQKAALDFNIQYIGDSVQINTFSFQTDGVDLSANGLANVGDDIHLDLAINDGRVDFGVLSKYIPQEMMDEMGFYSAQGVLRFNTSILGVYNDSIMPRVDADFSFENGAIKMVDYPEIKHFSLAGKASNGNLQTNATTSLDLSSLKVATKYSSFDLNAHILNIDRPIYKFETSGAVLIDEFVAFIPEGTLESISGRVKWKMGSSGEMPEEIGDDFTDYLMARTWAYFSVENLSTTIDSSMVIENFSTDFTYKPEHFSVQNLSIGLPLYDLVLENSSADITVKGSLADVDNLACAIDDMHLEFDNNTIDMQASLSNLTKPDYTFNGEVSLDLADLQKMVPDTLVTAMSGVINGHLVSQGSIDLDSIETQGTALAFENSRMALSFDEVSLKMTDTLIDLTDLNLAMEMKPDTISIDHFSGNYKGLDFALNATKVINAYHSAVLNEKEQLTVITSIAIGDVDYAFLEPFMLPADTTLGEDTAEVVVTNYTMDIRGDIAVKSFSMEDYEVDSTMKVKHLDLDDITCKFRVTDSTYIADSLAFGAFGGHMLTSLRYDLKADDVAVVAVRNSIDGMDFEQLLYDMDNFGQSELTSENMSGKLISETNVEMTMIGDSVPMDKMRMSGDFELLDGAIINFEAAEELSKFTGIKELDNIQFETLRTNVFLFGGAVYIPKTTIVNSAVDITFFGMQSIEEDLDEYDYHLELNLGDVLTGKREALMKKQAKVDKDAGEEVKRNGVNLYYGQQDGKIKKGFDSKKAMEAMQRRIRLQERFLNLVFHHERINYNTDFVNEKTSE